MHPSARDDNDHDRAGDHSAGGVAGQPHSVSSGPPRLKIKLTLNPPKPLSLYDRIKAKQEQQQRTKPVTPAGVASGGREDTPPSPPPTVRPPSRLLPTARPRTSGASSKNKNKSKSKSKKKASKPDFALSRLQKPRVRQHAASNASVAAPKNPTSTITKNGAARRILTSTAGSGRSGYNLYVHSDTEDEDEDDNNASDAFPTFVSASAMSTSDEEGDDEKQEDDDEDNEAGNDSDASSELTDLDDFSVQAEEERFIIAEARARTRRELLGDGNVPGGGMKKFDWQSVPRKTSGSGAGSTVAQDDTESDTDEEQDAELEEDGAEEEEPEPDVPVGGRVADMDLDRYWSSDSDDFDAAVFFASLDDSEHGSGSENDTVSELGAQSLDESAQAGAFARAGVDAPVPFVTQDIHGLLVFGDGAKDPALDLAFDVPSVPPTAVQSPNAPGDSTEDEEPEGDTMDVDTEDDSDSDDALGLESDGATTDDMRDEDFVRAPTPPPASINPLETLRTPALRVDLLRRRRRARSLSSAGTGTTSPSASSGRFGRFPSMGRFDKPSQVRVVVIDGSSKDIPSPFARKQRRERASRMRFPKLRRQPSPSPMPSGGEFSGDSMYSLYGGPSTSQFIELHDVLDTAILEDEEDEHDDDDGQAMAAVMSASESDVAAHGAFQHVRNLSRWDRIPMNTFRRTRNDITLPAMNHMTMSLPIGLGNGYGLKSSSSAWWEANGGGGRKRGKRDRDRERASSIQAMLALSPILFPVRGDDSGNVAGHHLAASQLKIHRDKERRKRKSKTVDSAAVKPVKRPIHAQRSSSLVNVPPLRI